MGLWGADNLECDGALDYLATEIVNPLVEKLRSVTVNPGLAEPDEPTSSEIMVAAEVLCLLCERCNAVPPAPTVVQQCRDTYLRVWDGYIDKLMPKPDYKRERRRVIEATFQRLLQLAQAWQPRS